MSTQTSALPEENSRVVGKKRKAKAVCEIQWRATRGSHFREWSRFKRYESLEVAQKVADLKSRRGYFEYRIVPY